MEGVGNLLQAGDLTAALTNEQANLEHSQLLFKVLEWEQCAQGLDNLSAGLCVGTWSTCAVVPALEAKQQLQQGVLPLHVFFISKGFSLSLPSAVCVCRPSLHSAWFMLFTFSSCFGEGTSPIGVLGSPEITVFPECFSALVLPRREGKEMLLL